MDMDHAIALLQRAVNGGEHSAQYLLGKIYLDDRAAPTNHNRAIELFTLSAH